jgi:hypothetical protein
MPSKRLNRRTVLRGVLATGGSVAIGLPLLDIMLNSSGTALAAGTPIPKRYVTWFFGNGVQHPLWVPAATGALQLTPELMPLASVQNSLTVVSGLSQMVGNASPHPMGSAACTTGASVANSSAMAPSIDQIVAGVNPGGKFTSLEVGVSNATPDGPENTLHTVSHRGPNAPNYPEFDPHAFFARVFAGATTTTTTAMTASQVALLAQEKKSILDTVLADGNDINKLLGANDQKRLSDHLDGIRQLEMRLQTTGTTPVTTTLMPPTDPATQGVKIDTQAEAPANVNEAMASMLSLALGMDLTRNATFIWSLPAAHLYFRQLSIVPISGGQQGGSDMNADFHNTICHTDAGNDGQQSRSHTGTLHAMTSLSVFLGKLAAITEGAGTVLDNSLVYVTSDTSWGKIHTTDDWPVLLAGKAGGAVKGNQHLRFQGQNLSNVLLTIANMFGANLTTIGMGGGQTSKQLTGL